MLQVNLLQVGVLPTRGEVERLLRCKQHYTQELSGLMARGNLPFTFPHSWSGCQMFAPQELVRLPAVAMHILNDRRSDILGRFSFHILSDAGVSITWKRFDQASSGSSLRFIARDIGAMMWPREALNNHDILGRTALHTAARQGSVNSVKELSRSGADLRRLCLNGLSLLHIAACHGHTVIVHQLIDKMRYHMCTAECYTPTSEECQENKTRCLPRLDELDDLLRTPFWYAARGSHFGVMSVLAERREIRVTAAQHVSIEADT